MSENTVKEPQALNNLVEFSTAFRFDCHMTPQLPPAKVGQLRVNLIREELNELEVAFKSGNLKECLDALADIQYVLSGSVVAFGFTDRFADAFAEVHRSNMSKACKTEEEVKATVAHYEAKGTPCFYEKEGDLYLVFREGDHKTLKSVGYSPADLKGILK